MAMAWGKKIFKIARFMVFLVIAFFMAIGFLMAVMTISFALPIGLNKSLWNSETV